MMIGGLFSLSAATVTYTFEAPNFLVNQTTPIGTVAPNSGDSTFRTTFTSSSGGNQFGILDFQANGLANGQSLVEFAGSPDSLTLTFNQSVASISLVFGVNLGSGGLLAGTFSGRATTSSAATPQTGGAGLSGGTFSFTSAAGFSAVTLFARNAAGAPVEFAIDNVVLSTAVPEPSTLIPFALASLIGFARHRNR